MHKRRLAALALILAVANGTSAWAGWGCAAQASDGAVARVWGADTENTGRTQSMKFCAANGRQGCHIIGCSENVDTQAQAHAHWPSEAAVIKCFKGPKATADSQCRTGAADR